MSEIEETSQEIDEEIEFEENELLKRPFTKHVSRKSSRKPLESRKSIKQESLKLSLKTDSKRPTLAKSELPEPDTPKQDSEKLSTPEKYSTKPNTIKKISGKSEILKRDSVKPDKLKLDFVESVKPETPKRLSVKPETPKRHSIKPETPKTDSIKDSLGTPNQESVKPDSSKYESDFEDEKLNEFPGEADLDQITFDEEKGFFYFPEKEFPSIWEKDESSEVSTASATALVSEVEETEEEKEIRKEREALINSLRQKLFDRLLLRRRNTYLNKKLVEHFKKRRMENVLKEEPKGLDLESKYLRSLYAFKEFKQAQEKEISDLTYTMEKYEDQIKQLEADLEENLKNSAARAKEVSLNLILTKTGKKINEKTVDRLLRRQIQKSEEKGKEKLKYIKIKNLIEEKELQLKAMEYFGEGLHIAVYEQMKIDNQNYSDKIEEKEDELTKLRLKTQTMIQNLAHVKEKIYAVEGDIELMEEKVFDVEKTFIETRERLTAARIKRDNLRSLFRRYKNASGLLTRTDLLRDFEESISKAKNLSAYLQRLKRSVMEKNRQENKLAKIISSANATLSDTALPMKIKIRSKTSNHLREVYVADRAFKNSVDLMVRKT